MSFQYDQYLNRHKANVKKGFDWIRENLPALIGNDISYNGTIDYEWQIGMAHDESKTNPDEYEAYDAYFYGGNRSYAVTQAFNKAWLLHIHRNPHHWQHWILINDDAENGEIALEMPDNYILEMICDWWSFSWEKGDLYEIFSWYEERKDYIKLHSTSRMMVEYILAQIKERLEEAA